MKLSDLGWNNYQKKLANFQSLNFTKTLSATGEPLSVGRIAIENKTNFIIFSVDGEVTGILKGGAKTASFSVGQHSTNPTITQPKVGDWVLFEMLSKENKALIRQILPRYSQISRYSEYKKSGVQTLAVNVDILFIIIGLDAEINYSQLERYIQMAEEGQVQPILILNKSDQVQFPDKIKKQVQENLPNIKIYPLSAKTNIGIHTIEHLIKLGQSIVFVGPSGAGKSTLINALLGTKIQTTKNVRDNDAKGRHTTTRREMFLLPHGGILIDTPGMRKLENLRSSDSNTSKITEVFTDLIELAWQCKYKNCDHIKSAGCAILPALANHQISKSHYQNFIRGLGQTRTKSH